MTTTTLPDDLLNRLRTPLNTALRGKSAVIELVLAGLLARGHLLIEDVPGLGKTTLAKALARTVGGQYARVQCTPDLLPTDITGFNVFNQQTRAFEFLPGPVFADILLADEINRATPRTQSALLEAMAERQVTVDTQHYDLSKCFLVIATQNPIEHHGTYPLPEAQLDRFAMKLRIGYPERSHEIAMLGHALGEVSANGEQPAVLTPEQLVQLQQQVAAVGVAELVRGYLVDLAAVTREHPQVPRGLSPRGVLTWQRVAQAWAYLQGRNFVTPDDIQMVALPVLEVRLGFETSEAKPIVDTILAAIPVPC